MLLNLIKHQQPNVDKIYLYVKDPFEPKYQILIDRGETVGIKELKNSKPFIDYSQAVDNVYKNLQHYNPTKKRKVLIVFIGMIGDMEAKKN